MKPNLSVEYCGVKFKNPMVIASASPSKNGDFMTRCADSGAGGVIAKTFSHIFSFAHNIARPWSCWETNI